MSEEYGPVVSRRAALRRAACGFGHVALCGMLGTDGQAHDSGPRPLAPRRPQFPPKCKRVIFLFMHGGVSHIDTFDPKSRLKELNGKPVPIRKPEFEFADTKKI